MRGIPCVVANCYLCDNISNKKGEKTVVRHRRLALIMGVLSLLIIASTTAYGWQYVASVGSTSAGGSARGAALSPDGAYIYIAGVHDRAIWKYDVTARTQVAYASLAQINPNAWGKAVFVTADGNVWAPATEPELYRFDANLNLIAEYNLRSVGINNPEGVVVTADGAIFVADRAGGVGLYKFTVNGDRLEPVNSFGNWGYVAVGADIRQPAIAKDGSILVGDYSSANGTIHKVDPNTGQVSVFATGVRNAYHIDVDAAGNVYVVQYGNNPALTVLDATGAVVTTRTAQELGLSTEASGIAVKADGSVAYVLDQRAAQGGHARAYSLSN